MADEARAAILARLRRAQVRAQLPEPAADLPNRYVRPQLDAAGRRARLRQELEALGVEVFVEASEAAVQARVKTLITGKSVLSWDASALPYGLGACLSGEKVFFGKDSQADQATADIGLTGCEAAVAETGSLALIAAADKPRAASLLPYVHVAVVCDAAIFTGMGEVFEQIESRSPLPYLVFITGPSRTADIELSLTLGVHGPGKLVVIIGP